MIAGGLRALRQHDLKLLLAFGTVSQLGFMFVVAGAGTADAAVAISLLLLAMPSSRRHCSWWSASSSTRRELVTCAPLPGFGRPWRLVVGIAVVSAASMAGVPLALGFVAKEADFEVFAHNPFGGSWAVLAGLTVGSMITAAYSIRFLWGAFTAGVTDWANAPPPVDVSHRPAPSLVAPAAVLAVVTVLLGVAPSLAGSIVGAAAVALVPAATSVPLAVWHGFNLPLVLSAVALVGGWLLFVARRRSHTCSSGRPAHPERCGRLPLVPPRPERRGDA